MNHRVRRLYPLPELLAPGPWTIQHLSRGGHSGRASRLFAAPLDPSPGARSIRAHELAHVRFSPPRPRPEKYGVRPDTLLAVEDARVNQRAAKAGIGESIREFLDLAMPLPDPREDLRRSTLLLVAAHGTLQHGYVEKTYGEAGDAGQLAIRLARRAIGAFTAVEKPAFRRTVKVSRMLDRLLDLTEGEIPEGTEHLLLRATEAASGGSVPPVRGKEGRPRWGRLERIEEPPRTVPFRQGRLIPSWRATDEGTLLRYPHRFLLDHRVFARRRRVPGGTILIDGSASMRLDANDLLALAEIAPSAEIACYEGNGDVGALRVLARAGRRVADSLFDRPLKTGANVIDGPALEWLSRRPGPRIWVSDGEVRGIGDRGSPLLFEDALRICKRAGIVRVRDAKGARDALRKAYARPGAADAPPRSSR